MATAPAFGMAIFHSRTTRGAMLEFHNRPWLVDIYKDQADRKVISKCSQVGMSDFAINTMLAHAMNGRGTLYVLPRQTDVYGFTPRRIDRLIGWSPFYSANCRQARKDSDSKTQKTIFGVDCFFVGAEAQENFYEKAADVLILDEYDKLNKANLPYAFDRIGSAKRKIWIELGNPIQRNSGIDAELEESDKKLWHVQCPHCNEWQQLDWLKNCIFQKDDGSWDFRHPSGVVCAKCERPMDRLAIGEWVAKYHDRQISGYGEISQIFANPLPDTMDIVLEAFLKGQTNPKEAQRFNNNVLGITYEGDGISVTFDMLSACATTQTAEEFRKLEGPVIAGADVGSRIHLHISKLHGGRRHKLFVGHVDSFEELARKCRDYDVKRGVIDALPEGHAVAKFMDDNSRWYRCFYNLEPTNKEAMVVDHKTRTIRVNKHASCDDSYSRWVRGDVVLAKNWQSQDGGDFVAQMMAPTRMLIKHKTDGSKDRYEWREENKPDHHFHADNYERIAEDMHGQGDNLVVVV